jgi:adenylate kinase
VPINILQSVKRLVVERETIYNIVMSGEKIAKIIVQIKPWLKTGSLNIFGMPFAGKDSRGNELAKLFDGIVIGGGDIIRNTPELEKLNEQVKDGSLAPTEEFLKVVLPYFLQDAFKNKPLILSSVGRWHGEEPGVMAATKESGHPLMAVIYIDISEEEMHRRWMVSQELQDRGFRHDDAVHVLEKRINEFKTKTLPVLDFYREHNLLIEISGEASHEDVLLNILSQLAHRAAQAK